MSRKRSVDAESAASTFTTGEGGAIVIGACAQIAPGTNAPSSANRGANEGANGGDVSRRLDAIAHIGRGAVQKGIHRTIDVAQLPAGYRQLIGSHPGWRIGNAGAQYGAGVGKPEK